MPTRLSQRFQQARIAAGLKPGQLASLVGLGTEEVGGNLIARFERDGEDMLSDRNLAKIASALGIPSDEVNSLETEERRHARAEWEAWSKEPIPTSFYVRMMPAVWHQVELPETVTTPAQVLEWARSDSRWAPYLRCLCWSRRHATYIRPDGTTYEAHTGFNEEGPGPYMRLG
jgi:transcriptional regulator with XRE-family HTH domain